MARISPDGKRILTMSWEPQMCIWDAQTGELIADLMKGSDPGAIPATASMFSTSSARLPMEVMGDFSRDGKRILAASSDGAVHIWDARTGEAIAGSQAHKVSGRYDDCSPDARWILTSSRDGTTGVYEAQTGDPLFEPIKHLGQFVSGAFSPDGSRVMTSSWDGTVRVWGAQIGRLISLPVARDSGERLVGLSPGDRVVVARLGSPTRVSPQTREVMLGLIEKIGFVKTMRLSPDGRRALTADLGNTARVWDVHTAKPLTEPMEHSGQVNRAVFSPDGSRIATVSEDRTARVWDAKTGKPLTDPMRHNDAVDSVSFSLDGSRVITSTDYGETARVWDVGLGLRKRPPWFPRLTEAVAGRRLNIRGVIENVPNQYEELQALRRMLARMSPKDPWVQFGRWVLADRATRTISPFSDVTVPQYLKEHPDEPGLESLRARASAR